MRLLFNNLSVVWNIKILKKKKKKNFVRRVHRCCVQSLVPIGEIAWEEFEKVGLRQLVNLWKETVGNGRGLYDEIQHNSVNQWI